MDKKLLIGGTLLTWYAAVWQNFLLKLLYAVYPLTGGRMRAEVPSLGGSASAPFRGLRGVRGLNLVAPVNQRVRGGGTAQGAKLSYTLVTLLLLTGVCGHASAQIADAKGERRPYYININTAGPEVYQVYGLLSLQYEDRYGKTADLPLILYNWKREKVGQYMLKKEYGLNYFNIDLESMGLAANGETYRCQVTGEPGHKYEVFFKLLPPPEKNDPEVNIVVNPVSFRCGDPLKNAVEFYGEIKNGKAPFKVNWYVMNDAQTDFLYQPKDLLIERQGHTPLIHVDQAPAYYVLLNVRDACGSEAQQMVYLTCSEKKKKIHTVFVEPLEKLPAIPKVTQ